MNIINRTVPRLKQVSRPAAWFLLTFGVFNTILGIALYTTKAVALRFFIVNNITTPQFWGACFFLVGVLMLITYWLNYWSFMRQLNVAGLFLKIFWLVALVGRQIATPDTNVFLILMFGTLAVLQIGSYLYFPSFKETKGPIEAGTLVIPKEILK